MSQSFKRASNCKPGDIAIVVNGHNVGKLVRIERAFIDHSEKVSGYTWTPEEGKDSLNWVVESLGSPLIVVFADGTINPQRFHVRVYADSSLRPIRPKRGADESMRWAESPTGKRRIGEPMITAPTLAGRV